MVKKILMGIVIAIVLVGMAALYLFPALTRLPVQTPSPQPDQTGFVGPTGSPHVNGPSAPPTVNDAIVK